jgi:glycosyltransferase involved in cell wall biosynthesis
MRFSIITPSYRSSAWLKLCIASVADQDVEREHIVQDSCSDDGTQEWLSRDGRVKAFIEKDRGMYDAVNRGLHRASGDILAYLNCDEQYLPGSLLGVRDYFEAYPDVEVIFGDALVVNPAGEYLCHRQASIPTRYHSWVSGNLAILTCSTFFRRSVIDRRRILFDPAYKALGDAVWVMRLLEQGVPMGLLGRLTSTFTETGNNLCLHPSAQREQAELAAKAPFWACWGKPAVILHYRLRRLLARHYWPKPLTYSIYTQLSPLNRTLFSVPKPTFRWKR